MWTTLKDRRGSVSVTALLLLFTLVLLAALVIEVGSLRSRAVRIQAVFDRAALAATGAIDTGQLANSGRLAIDAGQAESHARAYLVSNLATFASGSAGIDPVAIARSATVSVRPDANPPEVTLTGQVQLTSGWLQLAGVGPTVTYDFFAVAQIRKEQFP